MHYADLVFVGDELAYFSHEWWFSATRRAMLEESAKDLKFIQDVPINSSWARNCTELPSRDPEIARVSSRSP